MPTYRNKDFIRIMRPLPSYIKRDIYGIPVMEPQTIDISELNNGLWLMNMKNISSNDKNASKKIVHSFCYDDTLRRAYNDPIKYLNRIAPYYAVTSFDFSMDYRMDEKHIIDAVYENRWSGAFMQAHGKLAIPTVGWLKPNTFDICFAGLRDGGTFIISTIGVNNTECYEDFITGYKEMRSRFPNTKIICVGDRLRGMDDDVCYILYEESFGSNDKRHPYWQPRLMNWDMSIPKGV